MYTINPPAIFVHETVAENPEYMKRVERVVAAIDNPPPIETYTDEQIPELIQQRELMKNRRPMGQIADVGDPILLFNTFRFGDEAKQRALKQRFADEGLNVGFDLMGLDAFHWANYNLHGDPHRKFKVCRPCWRIHLQKGCLHRCLYCGLGGLLVAMVNIEEYCQHLKTLIEKHPWQQTYLLDDDGDPPCLEPELGCLGDLIEFFGTLEERYVVIHTKTWNTEWMRSLQHNGNTIIVWSLSGNTQSRILEPNTGTTQQRVEAARIAQEAGYQIRYKFKPIIPVKGWREDASSAIKEVFSKTKPDMISVCCFMWMDVDEMKRRLAPVLDLLDPEFLQLAEANRGNNDNPRTIPFPDEVRTQIYEHYLAEIRKYDQDIPVSLSTECWELWESFAPKMGMTATNYVCGCGPQSVPGAKKLTSNPFTDAVRNDAGLIPGVEPPI